MSSLSATNTHHRKSQLVRANHPPKNGKSKAEGHGNKGALGNAGFEHGLRWLIWVIVDCYRRADGITLRVSLRELVPGEHPIEAKADTFAGEGTIAHGILVTNERRIRAVAIGDLRVRDLTGNLRPC